MTDLIINYIALDLICIAALAILAHYARSNVLFTDTMSKYFTLAALIAVVVIMAELAAVVAENLSSLNRVSILIINALGFALSPFIAVVLSQAIHSGKSRLRSWLTVAVWINAFFALTSPWTGLIFTVSDGLYRRGPLFAVFTAAYLCAFAVLAIASVMAMKHYQLHQKSTFILLLLFTLSGTAVQVIWPQVHSSWLTVSLSLVLYYAYFCMLTETQDSVTGLLNRHVYDRHTKDLRRDVSGTVITFDLDNFKDINDQFGHQWGDYCLGIIGKLIRDCFCEMGSCYRTGGDEFCVICRTSEEEVAEETLSVFHQKIDDFRNSANIQGKLPMVSTGYAVFSPLNGGYDLAMIAADTQMYAYKNIRKNKDQTN
ncbi:MAG: GGDEF domain-containing protein [Eubacteriales bacterium]|nr:GGDEF domain-containing protein [Eubacteriales bacterium]MDD4324643.1 GGDEF domain-containing protein [Eubacteriales bacterium]MDD4542003.1 GGDEF domain-containing protein [Eubacteriales bacterium]